MKLMTEWLLGDGIAAVDDVGLLNIPKFTPEAE